MDWIVAANTARRDVGWNAAPEVPQDEWAFVAIAILPEKATSYVYRAATDTLETAENEIDHI